MTAFHVLNRGTVQGLAYRVLFDLDPAGPLMIWIAELPGGPQTGRCSTPEEGIRNARAAIKETIEEHPAPHHQPTQPSKNNRQPDA